MPIGAQRPAATLLAVTQLTIGLLGCGNVGGAFVDLLDQRRESIAARTGIDLRIGAIAVRTEGIGLWQQREILTLNEDKASLDARFGNRQWVESAKSGAPCTFYVVLTFFKI